MSFDREELTNAFAAHGRVARVVVVEAQGSTPREPGTAMLVWNGGQSGTIGGGALEYEAANSALKGTRLETIALGPSRGQCCGGSVTLAFEVFEDLPVGDQFYSRRIRGLKTKPLGITRQEAAARRGEPAELVFEDGWLFEPFTAIKTPLWIYGAGHVGRALINVMASLPGFEISWVDTAKSRYPETIPDGVIQLISQDPGQIVKHAPVNTHHLVLTYSHTLDLEICHQILSRGFATAGLIGSKTKWARFRKRLKSLGHSENLISRIECPIGDPNLGKHPQEIAVSVASSLLSRRSVMSAGRAAQID